MNQKTNPSDEQNEQKRIKPSCRKTPPFRVQKSLRRKKQYLARRTGRHLGNLRNKNNCPFYLKFI